VADAGSLVECPSLVACPDSVREEAQVDGRVGSVAAQAGHGLVCDLDDPGEDLALEGLVAGQAVILNPAQEEDLL